MLFTDLLYSRHVIKHFCGLCPGRLQKLCFDQQRMVRTSYVRAGNVFRKRTPANYLIAWVVVGVSGYLYCYDVLLHQLSSVLVDHT